MEWKEGAEICTKGIGNQFNEIIAENIPILGNDTDIYVQQAFQVPNRHYWKRTTP
jgi:hypothetical protein